ncbi:hypothetical protein Pelo_18914 [Pelomyxa schiedti]|nr:hypothetical protein Pelo_18914 [Pelomyxa schiedti]
MSDHADEFCDQYLPTQVITVWYFPDDTGEVYCALEADVPGDWIAGLVFGCVFFVIFIGTHLYHQFFQKSVFMDFSNNISEKQGMGNAVTPNPASTQAGPRHNPTVAGSTGIRRFLYTPNDPNEVYCDLQAHVPGSWIFALICGSFFGVLLLGLIPATVVIIVYEVTQCWGNRHRHPAPIGAVPAPIELEPVAPMDVEGCDPMVV